MGDFLISRVEIGQTFEIAGREYEFGPRGSYSFNLFLSWCHLQQIFPETWGEIIVRDPGSLEEKYWFEAKEIYLALLLDKIFKKVDRISKHAIEIGGIWREMNQLMVELAALLGDQHPLVIAFQKSQVNLEEFSSSFFGDLGWGIILGLEQGEDLPAFKRLKRD